MSDKTKKKPAAKAAAPKESKAAKAKVEAKPKAATPVMKPKTDKPLTAAGFVQAVAAESDVDVKTATAVLAAVKKVLADDLRLYKEATLHNLCKVKLVEKPATKAYEGTNPFTKQPCTFPAKEASKKVKLVPLSGIKGLI